MAQKSTIFISSTFSDLMNHREQLLYALNKMRQRIEAMEYFGARPGSPINECIQSVIDSDIYILILGMKYGSVDSAGVSITQREYEAAIQNNKQVFCYLINEKTHPVLPQDVETGVNAEKLKRFKSMVLEKHICEKYSSPEDLAVKIVTDIVRYLATQDDSFDVEDNIELED